MRVLVVHGPNLNLLGSRELDIYGEATLEEVNALIAERANSLGITLDVHQTAREGEIIELLHEGLGTVDGALLNPAGYSHTSRSIADAIRAVDYPVVEVHLSNIHAREAWRSHSITAEATRGVVAGFGPISYLVALHALKEMVDP